MTDRDPGARGAPASPGTSRSADQAFEALRARVERERAPADLFARIAERASAPARRSGRRRIPAIAAVGALAVAIAVAAVWHSRAVDLAGFRVAAASSDFRPRVDGALLAVEAGEVSLRVPELGVALTASPGARVGREGAGVRVHGGKVAFEVEPRPAVPAVVYVSGGRIEVLGTRFTVVQREGEGAVRLERGSIRFVDGSGRAVLLHPGEALQWPLSPPLEPRPPPPARDEPVPAAPPPRPRPPRAPQPPPLAPAPPASPRESAPPAPAAEEAAAREERRVLAEIDRLRIRREDQLLVNRLDEILAEPVAEPLRERLSFERCDVLAHAAGAGRRACAEIARHLAAYPGGEYTSRLEQSRRSLGCSP